MTEATAAAHVAPTKVVAWSEVEGDADVRSITVPDAFGIHDSITYRAEHQADFDAARANYEPNATSWLGVPHAVYMNAARRQAWLCGWESKASEPTNLPR